jgi:hypothetical protein
VERIVIGILMASTKKYVAPESSATAKVILTVEVDCDGSWGGDCPMDQIHKQAKDSAISILSSAKDAHRKIKIVSIDEVQAITVSSKSR